MKKNLPDIINRLEVVYKEKEKCQKEIIKFICDAVRDIIPDIKGWIEINGYDYLMVFVSEEFEQRSKRENGKQIVGWMEKRRLFELIHEIFPMLSHQVYDFGIWLDWKEQLEITDRLKKLKNSGEIKKKKIKKGGMR